MVLDRRRIWAALLAMGCASGASAAEPLRDLCPTRPGLGTAPCIVDKEHVLVEIGLADWTIEKDRSSRTDTVLIGDLLVRYGVTDKSEVQVGWTAVGFTRERQSAPRSADHNSGTGDVTVAFKHSLRNPGGDGLSVAVQPFATLPTGGKAIGEGDWGAGLLVPIGLSLNDAFQLQFTPEIDAAVDEDRHGRHLAYGAVAGLGIEASDRVSITIEGSASRHRNPDEPKTELLAAASLAWQPNDDLQLDVATTIGLNRDSSDARYALGISRRFQLSEVPDCRASPGHRRSTDRGRSR